MRIPAASALAISVLAALSIGLSPACAAKGKGPVDKAAVNAAVATGNACYARKDFAGAISAYEKADKISQHNCPECLLAIYDIYKRVGAFDQAMDEAKKAIKEAAADNNTAAAGKAHLCRGILLSEVAGNKPTDKKLAEAVAETRESIALDPSDAVAHFNLGVLLMRQEKDADGAAELKIYLALPSPNALLAKKAGLYIANPLYAREPLAPEFSFTTLEGAQISLAALKGKVTLLDFWGTWCPPCRESIPTIVYLHKKFADKPVEIVGVSSDNDQNAWRRFIAAHHMDWPEYIDLSDAVQQAFEIVSFPTYVVIDAQGMIRFRQSGFDQQGTAGELEDAIDKALKEKPPKEKQSTELQRRELSLEPSGARLVNVSLSRSSREGTAPDPLRQSAATAIVVVPGSEMETRLTHVVPPIYPQIAVVAHVSGTILLHAIISSDGRPQILRYISGPALLKEAALNAARQWRYQPYVADGTPLPADTTISVAFSLEDKTRAIQLPGNVMMGKRIHEVSPEYPAAAKAAHISGRLYSIPW